MATLSNPELLQKLKWRYAVKRFDATKKISPGDWELLEASLVLSPSSYGLQPWRFAVIESPALRAELRKASWNQSQVVDASHYVVFAAKSKMDEAHVDEFLKRIAYVRNHGVEQLAGYRKGIVGDVITGPRAEIAFHWMARQCYIALGTLMTTAAVMGVDTCPMEGLDPQKYDEILKLNAEGFQTVVACALGYRHPEDTFATLPKVRFERTDLVKYL